MKWLSMVWRETQQEWFAKAGIPWHGGMALMKYVSPSEEEDSDVGGPDDYVLLFFDLITDHKKEDGFSVLCMLEGMLHLMKEMHPDRTRAGIESDGAGCYSGKFSRLAIPLLTELTGTKIMYHSTGEAQCNKSTLDGHFGIAGPAVTAVVASGRQDATTAKDVVIAHKKSGAISHTVVREVEVNRQFAGKLGNNALSGIPTRSIAFTEMEYDAAGKLSGVRFFKHDGYGTGKFLSRAQMDKMWSEPQSHTGVVLVDWPVDANGDVGPCVRVQPTPCSTGEGIPPGPGTGSAPSPHPVPVEEQHRVLGPEGKKINAAKNLARREEVLANRRAADAREAAKLQKIQSKSNGFWCDVPGCRQFRYSERMLLRHQADKAKCPDASTQVGVVYQALVSNLGVVVP